MKNTTFSRNTKYTIIYSICITGRSTKVAGHAYPSVYVFLTKFMNIIIISSKMMSHPPAPSGSLSEP